jgi:hypothetical protein
LDDNAVGRDFDPRVCAADDRAAVGQDLDRSVGGLAVGIHQVELDVGDGFLSWAD